MFRFWKRLNDLYMGLLLLFFIVLLLIGIWQACDSYYVYYHSSASNVQMYKPDPAAPEAAADSPISSGMVGWITIDGTNMDYPVMQWSDNVHFLNIDPFGKYALSGSIFLDSRNSPDFSDSFSMIYGHHMDHGVMFGGLDAFLTDSYLDSHKTGTLMIGRTAQQVCKLEVFAAMRISARNSTVFDLDQEQIRSCIRENADIFTGERDERILALATCAGADTLDRTVVFCYILS